MLGKGGGAGGPAKGLAPAHFFPLEGNVWNILQHLPCKTYLHVVRGQINKKPSYIVEIICYFRHSQCYLQVIYTACHCDLI